MDCFWKDRFETYVKSKDINLWQVIQNGDFYFEVEDSETKEKKETSYELLKESEKIQLGKNDEAKMTIYNSLPRKEHEIKSLDPNYSRKNHVRKFLRALPLRWRAMVTAIEEAKDLATLPLGDLKTSDDSDSQGESDEDVDEQEEVVDEEEEAEAFNLLARNFCKFFRKGNRFGHGNQFGNSGNRFGKGRGYSQTSKAYIVLNKETMRIEESLNVTFDESLPESKSSPSVEDDRINEPIVQDLKGSPSLQVNVSNEGYFKSLKEARGHPIEQIWGRVKLLIQGSKLSLQEREYNLYDDFDMFTSSTGESIHSYYMRFAQLINGWKSYRVDSSRETNIGVRQEWLSVTTVRKKATWLDNAPNQRDPRIQHGLKEKMFLTEALESGAYLDPEQLAFLEDNRDTFTPVQASKEIPSPVAFQTDDLDAFDFDCDDAPSAKAVLITNLSSYNSNVILEVLKHKNNRLMELLISQDLMHTAINSLAAINDYKNMKQSFMDEYNETLVLKAELAKKHDMIEKAVYNELSTRKVRFAESCETSKDKTHKQVVQIILWYMDSGCSKHMTGQRSQLINFVSKFLGQFCYSDLEVALWKHTFYVRNLEGADLLSGLRDTNLYTISLDDMLKSSPICLLSKSSKTKASYGTDDCLI
nr:integrase, catalytic region, zinc finger, CCHC-type, peptidase aspartic, catalytic [Tanacetum cinerariifolium]